MIHWLSVGLATSKVRSARTRPPEKPAVAGSGAKGVPSVTCAGSGAPETAPSPPERRKVVVVAAEARP